MTYCKVEFGELKKAQDSIDYLKELQLSVLRNAAKRDDVIAEVTKNGGLKNALETIHSILRGSNKLDEGSRLSIESMAGGKNESWGSALTNALFKSGLKKVAESGALDKDIAVAMFDMSNGIKVKPGVAATIAKINNDVLENIKNTLNGVGGRIRTARDYVTRTEWSGEKLRQAAGDAASREEAFNAWLAKDLPRMHERTFRDIAPEPGQTMAEARKNWLRGVFDNFVSGVHHSVGSLEASGDTMLEGTNVAQQVSAHREIIWKDGEAWHQHMQDFGQSPTIHASMLKAIQRGSKATALLDRMGDTPMENLKMVIKRIEAQYKGDDAIQDFKNNSQSLVNEMAVLDGTASTPQHMGLAKAGATVRNAEVLFHLGGVGLTHFASIWPTVTGQLAQHGISRLEGLANTFVSLFKGMGNEERRAVLSELGAYTDGNNRYLHQNTGDESVAGRISATAGRFIDATGIHFVFDRTKNGVKDMLAHNLARNLTQPFEELNPRLQSMLQKYRIGSSEWEQMRGLQDLPSYNGRNYLTPAAASAISEDLSDKLMSYYADGAKHGVVTSGVRERALMFGGSQAGTLGGEFRRAFLQFKAWPIAAYNQVLEQEIFSSLSKGEAAWNIGKLMAIAVPAGYTRMAIDDMMSGKPPQDPRDPKVLLESAAKSGALGLAGDMLLGESGRMGRDGLASLGGPVVGDINELVKAFASAKEGEGSWSNIAHFAVNHIPFANLIYLKGTLDYMLWYHLYEAANPGWWERTNEKLDAERKRTMAGYTPGGSVPYGVPGVYLKGDSGSSGIFGGGQKEE